MTEAASPNLIDVDPSTSISTLLTDRVARSGGQPAVARQGTNGTWTTVSARELDADVVAAAKGLVARGINPGDRVAIMSRTRYEWTVLDFAVWAVGRRPRARLRDQLRRAGAVDPVRRRGPPRRRRDRRARCDRGRGARPAARPRGRARHRRRTPIETLGAAGADQCLPTTEIARRRRWHRPRRPRHDHLHLRRHRTPQGRRAHARQLRPPRRSTRIEGLQRDRGDAGSADAALPAARPRVRPVRPGACASRRRGCSGTRPTRRTSSPTSGPSARRTSWPCRACSRRSTTPPSRRPAAA